MPRPLADDIDAFPPRLRVYLTTLQTMLNGVLETEDGARLLNFTQALEAAPRVIQNFQIASFATWILQHSDDLGGPESEAVRWAYDVGALIAQINSQTPAPCTAEVFADSRFVQLTDEARGIFDNVPELVATVQAKLTTHRLATMPNASEAVQ